MKSLCSFLCLHHKIESVHRQRRDPPDDFLSVFKTKRYSAQKIEIQRDFRAYVLSSELVKVTTATRCKNLPRLQACNQMYS